MEQNVSFQAARYAEKRQKLLENAGKLISRKGYDNVSLEEIASKMKLKKTTLYYYFKGKHDILFNIQMQTLNICINIIQKLMQTDMPPSEKLAEVVRGTIKTATRNYFMGCVSLPVSVFPKKMRERIISERRRYYEAFKEIIQQGIEEGVFKEDGWKVFSFGTLGAMNWITQWYSPKGELSQEEIGDFMAEFVLDGLKKK